MNKRWSKEVRGLLQKKKRKESNRFIVEGRKNIEELLRSNLTVECLFYTEKLNDVIDRYANKKIEILQETTPELLKQNGHLQTNDSGLAVVQIPKFSLPTKKELGNVSLALDNVKDPGNLGTILRIADWYNIKNIFLSKECTDVFAPKVVASTMGAFSRINIHIVDLVDQLSNYKAEGIKILGADMIGTNIHNYKDDAKSIVIMGSESHGISEDVENILNEKITIPRFGDAESLNVAIATAIICDNLARN
ncbi:RNA methyltransferase [Flammeovirga sp. MY04]|uniref:TrmH family RNA methyltransferase n=1 Tax=Flammeovirga sp. MY04 TaxID=1191459 RepID=UPI000806377B|nr:RNA methyltransferase [Flammeovirga sp. MY04]ANQ48475.1 RNA methyltransferase [Flammeovirga sp. MY04]